MKRPTRPSAASSTATPAASAFCSRLWVHAKKRSRTPCRSINQEAQFEAEAFFKMSARRFVVGRGVAETKATLRVGTQLDLKDLGHFSTESITSSKSNISSIRQRVCALNFVPNGWVLGSH